MNLQIIYVFSFDVVSPVDQSFNPLITYQLDATSESQLNEDATSKATGDAVVPERRVALLVLQTEQQDLLHEGETSLLGIAVVDHFRSLVVAARVNVGLAVAASDVPIVLGATSSLN